MEKIKKLPDAEFEIMKVVWANEEPITSTVIMKQLGIKREWKVQTVISLMLRLVERGFLRTEKHGKERSFFSLVNREEYLKFETGNFMRRFHDNSFLDLINTVYGDEALTDADLNSLIQWAAEHSPEHSISHAGIRRV
jgi:predicted transcriptional regulator